MSSPRNWFRLPIFYRPRAERRESPALTALHWDGPTPRQNHVANISNSGAYLLTAERWNPGEILSLTLQRNGAVESAGRRGYTVQAKAVRRDNEGVGVSFLLPHGADLRLWESTIKSDVPQNEPEDVVREFRIAAAIAFINRISPQATEGVRRLFRHGLSNHRLESAIEITLHAEELTALASNNPHTCAHADVVLRILEDGSWTEIDWIQHYWSGLLASSCTDDSAAEPDMDSPGLLSQLTTIQTRIFAAACDGARKFIDSDGVLSAHQLTRSADELIQISDTHDRAHIERDVYHLTVLGLIEQRVKWKFFSLLEQADITPTPLALKLYARCHAHPGDPAAFYGTVTAETSTCAVD